MSELRGQTNEPMNDQMAWYSNASIPESFNSPCRGAIITGFPSLQSVNSDVNDAVSRSAGGETAPVERPRRVSTPSSLVGGEEVSIGVASADEVS